MKLSPKGVKDKNKPGTYGDGSGLYLQVAANGTKSWIYRYQINQRRRWLGLGGFPAVSLAKARKVRDKYRLMVKGGIDPLDVKKENAAKADEVQKQEAARAMTFERCAESYMDDKESEWKNRKHSQQWRNTLKTYAYPVIGDLPVEDVEIEHVLKILQPIWKDKTETATRVRNRVELVLDYASVRRYRQGENPARWKGRLDKILPKPSKVKEIKHHPALPYEEISDFMAQLRAREGLAAKALILTILTASRTSGTLNAEWSEFDLAKAQWVMSKERMKSSKEHRIPLSGAAMELLEDLRRESVSNFVFPGMRKGKPLSNMSMTNVLRRMDYGHVCVHGFRSTFRDWIAEKTNFPQRVAETAMAHQLKDRAEAAYQRGDLIQKRVELMEAWASYCFDQKSKVTRIRA